MRGCLSEYLWVLGLSQTIGPVIAQGLTRKLQEGTPGGDGASFLQLVFDPNPKIYRAAYNARQCFGAGKPGVPVILAKPESLAGTAYAGVSVHLSADDLHAAAQKYRVVFTRRDGKGPDQCVVAVKDLGTARPFVESIQTDCLPSIKRTLSAKYTQASM